MSPVILMLFVVGVTDMVGGVSGRGSQLAVRAIPAIAGAAAATLLASAAGYHATALELVVVGVISLGFLGLWTLLRPLAFSATSTKRTVIAGLLLSALGGSLLVAGVSPAWLRESDGGLLLRSLGRLPYEAAESSPARAILAIAGSAFLLTSANVVVRLALALASVEVDTAQSPDKTLRGGRIIGPIERLLIFGLALVGEPTAAALIISAKGLLRFPEINADSDDEKRAGRVDEVSEYLLVGSMVSWALALAPLLFMPPVG